MIQPTKSIQPYLSREPVINEILKFVKDVFENNSTEATNRMPVTFIHGIAGTFPILIIFRIIMVFIRLR